MLAQEQARCGWDVHIGIRRGGVHLDALKNGEIEIHQLGDFRSVDPRLFARIHALIKKIGPDVVQTWLPQMDVVGGALALVNGAKWVGTERSSMLGINDTKFMTWLRQRLFRYADAVVANSTAGEQYWRSVLPASVRILRVTNAVDVLSIEKALPANLGHLAEGSKFILVVGRLHYLKSVDISIRAIALLSDREDIKLLIIGEGPMRNELEGLIRSLGLKNRVFMLPYQPEWWGGLKCAKALISMSRCEGNPNVVLEAMAAGCPLVVSDIPEHREILDQQSAMFTPIDDPAALAAAIKRLLSDSSSSQNRVRLAKVRVSHMSIDVIAKAYESIYAQSRNVRGE
jgi:glycosyltransferase involved in cell wall biosynthesis